MILTLTTDFGVTDGYVGAMKGVILSLVPRATIVDLTHAVPAQDVAHGAFVLRQAAPYFPPETVHVAVVDPGVGTARRGIVVVHRRRLFVGPDNGLFSPFLDDALVYELTDPDLWLPRAAATFHGRDLFAPAAAHLAQGMAPADCGSPVADPVRLPAWALAREGEGWRAAVVHVDHFGNCVTGLEAETLADRPHVATLPDGTRLPVRRTYAEVAAGEGLALVGSTGLVEVAVRNGRADARYNLARGDGVTIAPA